MGLWHTRLERVLLSSVPDLHTRLARCMTRGYLLNVPYPHGYDFAFAIPICSAACFCLRNADSISDSSSHSFIFIKRVFLCWVHK